MRVAIIDDMPQDRHRLSAEVSRWARQQSLPLAVPPDLFESGEEFLGNFSSGKYDVVFLDIYMGGINGMDTARKIRETDAACRLVFTTTSSEFAVDSYEVDSSWYLVKPYSYEKLSQALDRCSLSWQEQNEFLLISGRSGEEKLPLHQIAWT